METHTLNPLLNRSIILEPFGFFSNSFDAVKKSDYIPPYNLAKKAEDRYEITISAAGFSQQDLDIKLTRGMLTIRGKKPQQEDNVYIHQGIPCHDFVKRFDLADHVEVVSAQLKNGLLFIALSRHIPEEQKPKDIAIESV